MIKGSAMTTLDGQGFSHFSNVLTPPWRWQRDNCKSLNPLLTQEKVLTEFSLTNLCLLTYTNSNSYMLITLLYNIMMNGVKTKFIKLGDNISSNRLSPGAMIKIDVFQS